MISAVDGRSSLMQIRRIKKGLQNLPNLVKGYNIYVNRDKLELIKLAFEKIRPGTSSFADLGGVWRVNAAYTIFALKTFAIQKAFIVDTNYDGIVDKKLSKFGQLVKIDGNFGNDQIVRRIGKVDAVFFFDVLLHQVAPNWDDVLVKYAQISDCFLIFNQQFIGSRETFRLTDLPLEKYKEIVPGRADRLFDFVCEHQDEINREQNRPWKDIHNIFQWAITDDDLRATLQDLGYEEVYYKNCGPFSDSQYFENHAFVFARN